VACLLSLLTVGLLFVPTEFLSESARAMWATMLQSPPRWAQLLLLGAWWLSVSVVEPIYVAAGFGLYLHRRTQLEAWDVELVFRRLAARARELARPRRALLAVALLCGSLAWSPATLPRGARRPRKPCPTANADAAQLLGESARAPDRASNARSIAPTPIPRWRAHARSSRTGCCALRSTASATRSRCRRGCRRSPG
jgi:hypothetical protein